MESRKRKHFYCNHLLDLDDEVPLVNRYASLESKVSAMYKKRWISKAERQRRALDTGRDFVFRQGVTERIRREAVPVPETHYLSNHTHKMIDNDEI